MATQIAALNGIEDLNKQLGHLWAERIALEKELALVNVGIQTTSEDSRSLKKRFAQGDAGASSLLDKTEADHRTFTRKEEGLRLALEELEPKITIAQQSINAARAAQDEQRQEQQFVEACNKAAVGVERVLALHAQACQALAEVRLAQKEIGDRFGNRGLSAAERIVINPLANPVHHLKMTGWTHPRAYIAFGTTIEIEPLLPPSTHMNGNGARKS